MQNSEGRKHKGNLGIGEKKKKKATEMENENKSKRIMCVTGEQED